MLWLYQDFARKILFYKFYVITFSSTLYSFTQKYVWRLLDFDADPIPNYMKIRNSWLAFLELLPIEYESTFMCDLCGTQPDIVIGKSISIVVHSYQLPNTCINNIFRCLLNVNISVCVFLVLWDTRSRKHEWAFLSIKLNNINVMCFCSWNNCCFLLLKLSPTNINLMCN